MKKNPIILDWQENWRSEWQSNTFRYKLILSLVVLVGTLLLSVKYLSFIESRSGVPINDLLLKYLPSYDLSGYIFFIIYSALVLGISHISQVPFRLIPAFYVYTVVLIFRMASIYFIPLEAPENIILLRDPFVEFFTGTGTVITKDLFFSGHTATICILYFFAKNKWLKTFFLVSGIALGTMLLIQHVHYTIDVIAAPFISYAGYRLVLKIYRKSRPITSLSIKQFS